MKYRIQAFQAGNYVKFKPQVGDTIGNPGEMGDIWRDIELEGMSSNSFFYQADCVFWMRTNLPIYSSGYSIPVMGLDERLDIRK